MYKDENATFGSQLCVVMKLWIFRKVDQTYLKSFELWYWRGMEKISWSDRLKDEALEESRKK